MNYAHNFAVICLEFGIGPCTAELMHHFKSSEFPFIDDESND